VCVYLGQIRGEERHSLALAAVVGMGAEKAKQ
jgi:hypothetical protein